MNKKEFVYTEVLEAVDFYFAALYRGDVEALTRSFHPKAIYATKSEGELLHLDMPTYFEVVRKRASPESRDDSRHYEVSSIHLAGADTAQVTLRSEMMGKRFTDFITFLFIEDRWQIIAKVFHFDYTEN